jgi:electron transfer flavoprotein beta subunit
LTVVHVFAKVVPDVSALEHDPATLEPRLDRAPRKLGDADLVALEAGIRVKEKLGGEVVVLSSGSGVSEAVLREALAMGADRCLFVDDASLDAADSWVTANILAALSRKAGAAELYICGEASSDHSNYQLGPRLAETLGLDCITHVTSLEVLRGKVTATRSLEDSLETVEAQTPIVVSVGLELAQPRLPSLLMIRAATRKPVQKVSIVDLGLGDDEVTPRVSRLSLKAIKTSRRNRVLSGDPRECALTLLKGLGDEGVLRPG